MVPKLTAGGNSFEGAAAYYLADKAAPGQARPRTAARVAWTATRNLHTADAREGCRIMAATVECRSALKRAAGVKQSGRKLARPVLAFSLSWHPDERPTRQEQEDAAAEALAALGLAAHQAIVVCHTDEPHAHVHVIVNRIDPLTGKAAPLSKSKLALSRWAEAFEARQGRVLCQARVENNARRAGTRPGRAAANRSRDLLRVEIEAGAPHRPEAQRQREIHAALFSVQAGAEARGRRRRDRERAGFHAERQAGRRAAADRLHERGFTAAHPALTEAEAATAALLAGDRPADALAVLTRDRSTFTRAQLERFVGRHTPNAAAFASTMARLDAAPELIRAGKDARGQVRFTTRAHRDLERRMADAADALARLPQGKGDVPARFTGWALSADQAEALQHVLTGNRLACVSGVAGTGKSTMLDAARQSWERAGFQVQGMALAAEAAHGLMTGSGIKNAGTIHSRLYLWEGGRNLPGPRDVVVVDEAGMVGSRQLERLLHFARAGGAKVVLVGDAQQLQAIEAGGAFRAVIERVGDVVMRTVRRQKPAWMKDATAELASGRTAAALARYEAAGMVHGHDSGTAAKAALIDAWDEARRADPGRSQIVLAFLRRDVAELNALARAKMREAGTLGHEATLTTATGPLAFATGDRVAFTRNDGKLGVRNGSLGTIEAMHGRTLTVRLDGAAPRRITVQLDVYGHLTHGYAMTVHKSQGATVDRAHLLVSPNLDRHAAYVAMSRHRERVDLHWSSDTIPTRAKLDAVLSRANLKDTTLDYAEDREREHAARREAADAMRDRVRRRAAGFARREASREGRMDNARALLGSTASGLAVARLARDAVERARLFRAQQNTLRGWARRVTPPPAPARPREMRPSAADCRAAQAAHDRETLHLMATMQARHAAERSAERDGRATLRRDAAAAWRRLALGGAVAALAKWSGYLGAHWLQTHPLANDNAIEPPRGPSGGGPRPL